MQTPAPFAPGTIYLAVVVVDAETPEELVVAFAAQALRPLITTADNANRAKYLMYFISLL